MPYRNILLSFLYSLIDLVQWLWILAWGYMAGISFDWIYEIDYFADFHKVAVTVSAMLIGTYLSYRLRKYLNRKKRK
ncbi:MAG: hypothetical protein WBG90_18465 [Saonia sp.]